MTRGGICLALAAGLAVLALAGEVRAAGNEARPTTSQPLLFTADEVQYDQDLGLTVAKGNVEISEGDQILLADTVTYNQRTDTVTATGHVSLMQPTGDIAFADFMELHDNLRDGFIKDIRILLSDRSRMAGNTARRSDGGTRTELRHGVYSPCQLCQDDPSHPPVWQIKADRIVDDKNKEVVEYYGATMEIDGIPVFYTPYLSHPDPSVKRASGFLPPSIGTGNNLGYHVTIPYFWAISGDRDLTLRPLFTTKAGDVLDGDYRQAFDNGRLDYDGSIGVGSREDSGPPNNPNHDEQSVRYHLMGTSVFDLNPNWRAGLDVQRESDMTYMLQYHFPQPSDFLTSHAYAEDFGPRSYGNISAYAFQTLNPLSGDGTQPIVAPVANYDWVSEPDRIGGRLSLNGDLLNLERRNGPEMRRVSGGTQWRLPFNGPIGDRFVFMIGTRLDAYQSDNVQVGDSSGSNQSVASGRVFPQGALQWRYPWVRHDPGMSEVIEPMAAFVAAPNGGNPAQIPNEDSQGYEFDETSLFRPNRLPGYDVVDSGQRVDYGLHTGLYNDTYGSSNILVGQSYRLEKSTPFQIGSGLETQVSDVVGRLVVSPADVFDLFYRLRLDHSDLAMRRQEAGFKGGPSSLKFGASLISVSSIPGLTPLQTGTQVSANLEAALNRYWSLKLNDTRSISSGGATIYSGVSLVYQDDCFAVKTTVQQSGIRIGNVTPGVDVLLTFVFKNLGEVDEQVLSAGGTQ
ncbi:MAG: LPS assembly protein LptD [Stellaceae bacterium]